jgi:hypothetical protein
MRGPQRFSRRWWRQFAETTAALLLVCFAVSFLLNRVLPQVYFAKTVVQPIVKGHLIRHGPWEDPTAFLEDHFRIVRSDAVMDLAIRRLGSQWGGRFPASTAKMPGILRDSLQLRQERGFIEIGVWWNDRHEAAEVANAIATSYRESCFRVFREKIDAELRVFRQEVDKQRKLTDLAAAEAAQIRARDGIDDPDPDSFSAAVLSISDHSTNQMPYMGAKARYVSAKRIFEAAQIRYSTELLSREGGWTRASGKRQSLL